MKSPTFYQEKLETKGFSLPSSISLFGKGLWMQLPFVIGCYYGASKVAQTFRGDPSELNSYLNIALGLVVLLCLVAFILDRPIEGKILQGRLVRAFVALIPTFLFTLLLREYYYGGFHVYPSAKGNIEIFYRTSEAVIYAFLAMGVGLFIGTKLLAFVLMETREDSAANKNHYGWAQELIEEHKKRIEELLEYDEDVKLTLTECVAAPEKPEATLIVLLGLYVSLMLLVTVSALTATGENLIITVNLLFIPLIMLSFLVFPKVRNQHRFVALPILAAHLISYTLMDSVQPLDWFLLLLTVVISIPLLNLLYQDFLHWRRRRFLVVTDKRLVILTPARTDGKALLEVDTTKRPIVIEDNDFTLVKMAPKEETKPLEFCIATHPEVEKFKEVAPQQFTVLGSERKAPFCGWRATPIVITLVLATGWHFYSVIYLGMGIGMTTICSLKDWTDGKAEQVYRDHCVMTRYFPCSATLHWFKAMTAADTERYFEAIEAYTDTKQYCFGGGSLGKMLREAKKSHFEEFCNKALDLRKEVDSLRVPRGVPVGSYREIEYARRYAKMVKELEGIVLARFRVIQKHLRKAVDYGGASYPKAKLELAEALVGTGVYAIGNCYYSDIGWDLEARKLLNSVNEEVDKEQYLRIRRALDDKELKRKQKLKK